MLQDRDYMHSSPGSSRQGSFLNNMKSWTAIKTIVVLNVIFFILQLFVIGETSDSLGRVYKYEVVTYYCQLSSIFIQKGELWRIISHMFVHADFFHIFFNMFVLASFGKPVEQRLGKKRFFLLYFFAGLLSSLIYLIVNWKTGIPAIGASGAVMGVFMTAALFMPTMQVYFFLIPIPIKIWKFIKWYAGISFALLVLRLVGTPIGPNWAHSAHLGGMLGGWLFVKLFLKMKTPTIDFSKWFSNLKAKKKRDGFTYVKKSKKTGSYTKGEAADSSLEDVDRILDKMSASGGIGSLTEEEKAILENARKNLRR